MIPTSLKAGVTLQGAVWFSAHVRRPVGLKRIGGPLKDTVQCCKGVGIVQVADPYLTTHVRR